MGTVRIESQIEEEMERVLNEMREGSNRTSQEYMVLAQRLSDMAEALRNIKCAIVDEKQVALHEEEVKLEKKFFKEAKNFGELIIKWTEKMN